MIGVVFSVGIQAGRNGTSQKEVRMTIEERFSELGIELPTPPPPAGNYIGFVRVGNLVFLSGHGPLSAR